MNYEQYKEMFGETVGYTLSDCQKNESSVEKRNFTNYTVSLTRKKKF
jgi:hypothetical protein